MKQFILFLSMVTVMASCKTNTGDAEQTGAVQLLPAVTAYNNTAGTDTSTAKANEALHEKTAVKTVTKIIYVTKKSSAPVAAVPAETTVPAATQVTPAIPTTETSAPVTAPLPGTVNDNSANASAPVTVNKKGWSNAAKGAAIGAGAGAIGGAIFSKKKGLGAVIGGVAGAAGGYIIGKNIDKRNAGK